MDNQVTNNRQLPKFNEVISIQIEVSAIYDKLIETFPVDYKHKELLSHAIVGSSLSRGNLGYIYNALNGFTNDIDFKVGETVICSEESRWERYDANKENEYGSPILLSITDEKTPVGGDKPKWKARQVPIGECVIESIDIYKNDKLNIEFIGWNNRYAIERGEEASLQTTSVNHKNCTKVPLPIPQIS